MYKEKARWTATQERFVKDNYEKMTDEQISNAIGRSLKSVRRKRERMLLAKAMGRSYCKARETTPKIQNPQD